MFDLMVDIAQVDRDLAKESKMLLARDDRRKALEKWDPALDASLYMVSKVFWGTLWIIVFPDGW